MLASASLVTPSSSAVSSGLTPPSPTGKRSSSSGSTSTPSHNPHKHTLTPPSTILKGVPTNAQLTLTLLRVGEANKAPLPPPPSAAEPPPEEPATLTDASLRSTGAEPPLNATPGELDAAIDSPNPSATAHETSGSDIDAAKSKSHGRKGSRVLNFFRGTARGVVETAIGADKLKAKAGSDAAKDRLGAVPPQDEAANKSGPVSFKARYHGNRGRVYITAKATIPCVAFSSDGKAVDKSLGDGVVEGDGHVHPAWSVPVAEITEMKKVGGYGWKAKLVVGWALGKEVADGLEITDRAGEVWKVTAVPLRDELFNRLVAMGGQKWEAW